MTCCVSPRPAPNHSPLKGHVLYEVVSRLIGGVVLLFVAAFRVNSWQWRSIFTILGCALIAEAIWFHARRSRPKK
jgi:hypothetical protein